MIIFYNQYEDIIFSVGNLSTVPIVHGNQCATIENNTLDVNNTDSNKIEYSQTDGGFLMEAWKDVKIDAIAKPLVVSVMNDLDDSGGEIGIIQSGKRREEYIVERVLLKHLMGSSLQIYHRENGSPYIKLEGEREKFISISHSNGWVMLALCNQRVGVDIEKKQDRLVKLKHKFLSNQEISFVSKQEEANQLSILLLLWCAKEAVFKLIEKPLPEFSEEILVDPFVLQPSGLMYAVADPKDNPQRVVLHYTFYEDFAWVVAKLM